MKKKIGMLLALGLSLWLPVCAIAETVNYVIAQAYQEKEDDTRLHLRVESSGAVLGEPLALTKEDIREVTLGTGDTPVTGVLSVQDDQAGGMSYVFVLDHAMPIGKSRLDEMKTGMRNWIQAMGAKDCAAILVVEEEEIRNVTQGFTSDKDQLLNALEDYGKADEDRTRKNMIYSGIRDAILMASTDVAARPYNCSIVVFSNGADTYQTRVTLTEISELLGKNNLPMYVVGYAYSAQKSALASLVDVAKNSFGWAEDATPSNDAGPIDEAFDRLRTRICNGYDIELDCSDGFVSNGLMTVAVNLKNPDVLFKRNVELYLIDRDEEDEEKAAAVQSAPAAGIKDTEEIKQDIEDAEEAERAGGAELFGAIATFLRGTVSIAGKDISNAVICAIAALALLVVLGMLKSRKAGGKEPARRSAAAPEQPEASDETVFEPANPMPGENRRGTIKVRNDPAASMDGDNRGEKANMPAQREEPDTASVVSPPVSSTVRDFGFLHVNEMTIRYTLPGMEEQTKKFSNPADIQIGRGVGNLLILKDSGVSAHHVKISCNGDQVEVQNISRVYEDGTRNRLLVNGVEVSEKCRIESGARLIVGSIPLEVEWSVSDQFPTGQSGSSEAQTSRGAKTWRVPPVELTATYYLGGEETVTTVRLGDKITIGSDKLDTLRIPDESISRHHLTIERKGKTVTLSNTSRNDAYYGQNPIYYQSVKVEENFPYEQKDEGMLLYLGDNAVKLIIQIHEL